MRLPNNATKTKKKSKILQTQCCDLGFRVKLTKALDSNGKKTFILSGFNIKFFTKEAHDKMLSKVKGEQ